MNVHNGIFRFMLTNRKRSGNGIDKKEHIMLNYDLQFIIFPLKKTIEQLSNQKQQIKVPLCSLDVSSIFLCLFFPCVLWHIHMSIFVIVASNRALTASNCDARNVYKVEWPKLLGVF